MAKKEKTEQKIKVVFLDNFQGQFNQFKIRAKAGDVQEVDEAIIDYLRDHKVIRIL